MWVQVLSPLKKVNVFYCLSMCNNSLFILSQAVFINHYRWGYWKQEMNKAKFRWPILHSPNVINVTIWHTVSIQLYEWKVIPRTAGGLHLRILKGITKCLTITSWKTSLPQFCAQLENKNQNTEVLPENKAVTGHSQALHCSPHAVPQSLPLHDLRFWECKWVPQRLCSNLLHR